MADWTTPSAIHSKCGDTAPYLVGRSIDENTATDWWHNANEAHWIIFDMGETKRITKITLFQVVGWRWGGASGLYVYVGDDSADLGAAVWEGALNANGWQESGAFDKNGRYVKLLSKLASAEQSIYEFDAMAEAVEPPPEGQPYISRVQQVSGMQTFNPIHMFKPKARHIPW